MNFKTEFKPTIMKNILLGFVALLLSFSTLAAQGKSELKAAEKAFDSYSLSGNDLDKLSDAATNIAVALQGSEVTGDPKLNFKANYEAGQIYGAIMNQFVIIRTSSIGSMDDLPSIDNPAVKAVEALTNAFNITEKKGDKAKALKALKALQGNLSNAGIFAIQDKDYANSYINFSKSVMLHDFLLANGAESDLTMEGKVNDEKYYAAVSALLTEQYDAALPMYESLKAEKYEESGVYDGLYKIYSAKGDKEKAIMFLNEGREAFPDDSQLLFTEINYYLGEKKLDVLIEKIELAIEREPDNVSLYATLGNVYDNLYQKAATDGEETKAADYFTKAKGAYESALEMKPDFNSAIYAIGALYYNRGASMTQELVRLNDDFSKEGQKKYDALKLKVDGEFEAALPYFKQAEQVDPNDLNTLSALKEIYARKSEFEISKEFKTRIETIQGGGTVESYFKSN